MSNASIHHVTRMHRQCLLYQHARTHTHAHAHAHAHARTHTRTHAHARTRRWGIAAFAWRLGRPEAIAGAALNTLAMVPVTRMVEARMLQVATRREAWIAYAEATSVWVPLPKRRLHSHTD
jgi:hypothetical protein